MKVFKKQKLFSLLTSILSLAFVALNGFSPKYFSHSAIGAVGRQNIFSIDNSVPTLPGDLALNKTQKQEIFEINRILGQEIQQILTEDQLQQLISGLSNGLSLLPALSSLTLTQEQKKTVTDSYVFCSISNQTGTYPQAVKVY